MKISKFVRPTLKEVMAEVISSLGEDAVIITTRNVREGVEVVAARSEDLDSIASPVKKEQIPSQITSTAALISERTENQENAVQAVVAVEAGAESKMRRTIGDIEREDGAKGVSPVFEIPEGLRKILSSESGPGHQSEVPVAPNNHEKDLSFNIDAVAKMMTEFDKLKEILSAQTDMLVWRDSVQRDPVKAEIWELLRNCGFSPLFARKVVEKLPEGKDKEAALEWVKYVLTRNIPVIPKGEDMVNRGGVYALVGPTGVGKTTTTAKIAARCIMKHGKDSVGLVTTDSFRIGAQDQLRIYGRILAVPVYTAQTFEDLMTVRQTFSRKHLVIIDTVGMAQRDERMESQAKMLRQTEANRVLLLNAASQPETLDDVARHYKVGGLTGCIISKLDEAIRYAGAVDTAIRHKLPIHYLATGQQVPEDLYDVSIDVLIRRSLNSKASSAFDINDQEKSWMGALSHRAVASK